MSSASGQGRTQVESTAIRDKIRAWKLLNQGRNSCYANSLMLSLMWSETYLGHLLLEGPLGLSLRPAVRWMCGPFSLGSMPPALGKPLGNSMTSRSFCSTCVRSSVHS